MMGSEVCVERGNRVISTCTEDQSGDEEPAVLPRHTKVVVTGNNRTKSVLVGLHGVVKKAVGLGGWHWLVLKNGIEVKLQRNALSVLEPPKGDEVDDEVELSSSSSDLGEKDHEFANRLELCKVSKRRARHTRPWGPSASAKSNKLNCINEYRTSIKDNRGNRGECGVVMVESSKSAASLRTPRGLDFSKLGSDSLWRYLSRFHLDTYYQPNISRSISSPRDQMVNLVQHHFLSQQVNEVQVIAEFVRAAKRLRRSSS